MQVWTPCCLKMVKIKTGLHRSLFKSLCLVAAFTGKRLQWSSSESQSSAGLKSLKDSLTLTVKGSRAYCVWAWGWGVCVFSEGGVCVHTRSFSNDLSLPQGPATLICCAHYSDQPSAINNRSVATYGPPRTHTHNIQHVCVLWWLVDTDI